MPRGVKKAHLPEKICVCCQRPFSWRKKWEKDWENVKYCSKKCRKEKEKP
ncbi:MAG: DUF2256 domain-containing protein [Flavobacteriaceae bacterium]